MISPENKRYRAIINRSNSISKEEDVFNLLELQPGRVTFRENRLIIYDSTNRAITLSLYLPKMVSDPKSREKDGLKKFVVGKSKSNSKHVIRVRYHTGNWIFVSFDGDLGRRQTEFLEEQFLRLMTKKMLTFGIRMGRRAEYDEMKESLIETYERLRCTYSKPRVFGIEDLPYKKYYPWVKYEKPGRKRKIQKKITVQRRRSADYFRDETKFEGFLVDLGYDPAANLTVVSEKQPMGLSKIKSNYSSKADLSGALAMAGTSGRRRPLDKVGESMDEYNIYDGSQGSFGSQRIHNPFLHTDSPNLDQRKKSKNNAKHFINPRLTDQLETIEDRPFQYIRPIPQSKCLIDQFGQKAPKIKKSRQKSEPRNRPSKILG